MAHECLNLCKPPQVVQWIQSNTQLIENEQEQCCLQVISYIGNNKLWHLMLNSTSFSNINDHEAIKALLPWGLPC